MFKWAVDGLTQDPTGSTPVMAGVLCLTPPALLMMYGVTRAIAAGCNELRNAVFANVRRSLLALLTVCMKQHLIRCGRTPSLQAAASCVT